MALFGLFKKKETPLPEDEREVAELHKKAVAEQDWRMAYRTAERMNELGYAYHWILGECHLYGRGVPKDTERAMYHFETAATTGSTFDMFRYAELLTEGKLLPANPKRAQYLYRRAASYDQPDACLKIYRLQTAGQLTGEQYPADELAWMLLTAAVHDIDDARDLFRAHAAQNTSSATLYKLLAEELNIKEDQEQKLAYTKMAAAYGDADALFNLGHYFLNGIGTYSRSYDARLFWEAAADIYHDSEAMYRLAILYQDSYDMGRDWKEKMVYWYTRAAEAGHGGAANNLAAYYQNLEFAKPIHRQNFKKTLYWLQRGAELGDSTAMYNLAQAYYEGKMVPKDKALSDAYMRKAAALGHERAQQIVLHMDTKQ